MSAVRLELNPAFLADILLAFDRIVTGKAVYNDIVTAIADLHRQRAISGAMAGAGCCDLVTANLAIEGAGYLL
jgi:hypothetical protein